MVERLVKVHDLFRAVVVSASVRVGSWLAVWLVAQGMTSTDAENLMTAFGIVGGVIFDYALSMWLKRKAKKDAWIVDSSRGLDPRRPVGRGRKSTLTGQVEDEKQINDNQRRASASYGEDRRAERV